MHAISGAIFASHPICQRSLFVRSTGSGGDDNSTIIACHSRCCGGRETRINQSISREEVEEEEEAEKERSVPSTNVAHDLQFQFFYFSSRSDSTTTKLYIKKKEKNCQSFSLWKKWRWRACISHKACVPHIIHHMNSRLLPIFALVGAFHLLRLWWIHNRRTHTRTAQPPRSQK